MSMIRSQESNVNITCSMNYTSAWVSLCFSPTAHLENSREEARRVQFQRQRPAGKCWCKSSSSVTLGSNCIYMTAGSQVDHCCRALWKQAEGTALDISCQVKTFHSTIMDFSLPFKQTSYITIFLCYLTPLPLSYANTRTRTSYMSDDIYFKTEHIIYLIKVFVVPTHSFFKLNSCPVLQSADHLLSCVS